MLVTNWLDCLVLQWTSKKRLSFANSGNWHRLTMELDPMIGNPKTMMVVINCCCWWHADDALYTVPIVLMLFESSLPFHNVHTMLSYWCHAVDCLSYFRLAVEYERCQRLPMMWAMTMHTMMMAVETSHNYRHRVNKWHLAALWRRGMLLQMDCTWFLMMSPLHFDKRSLQ